ncbi:MAG: LamG-like jellyroll fold domain-containing protein [Planctomycetota bacterium]
MQISKITTAQLLALLLLGMLASPVCGQSYQSVTAGAVLHAPLQDSAANTTVEAGAAADGTLVGGETTATVQTAGPPAATWLPGAFVFDGSADAVTFDMLSAADNLLAEAGREWSVSCWWRCESDGTMFGRAVASASSRELQFYRSNTTGVSVNCRGDVTVLTDRTGWHFTTVAWDGTTLRVYTDDEPGSEVASVGSASLSSEPFIVGARTGATGFFLDGAVAGVVVTDSSVRAVHDELFAGPEPTLVTAPVPTVGSESATVPAGTWNDFGNGVFRLFVDVILDGADVPSKQNLEIVGPSGTIDLSDLSAGQLQFRYRAENGGGISSLHWHTTTAVAFAPQGPPTSSASSGRLTTRLTTRIETR